MGTQADNNRDRFQKGRTAVGEHLPQSKLSEEKVIEIRRRYMEGETGNALGEEFGVGQQCINKIVTGKRWRNAGGIITPVRIHKLMGEKHPMAKLNEERVIEIRQRYACGEKQKDIANEFGMHIDSVHKIINRRRWSHVK